jgi:hypothetical protein
LLDAIWSRIAEEEPWEVILFLDFISRFIAKHQDIHAPLCVPRISDIILGICLQYFIPNTFSSVDVASTAAKTRNTIIYKTCKSVLDRLIGYMDHMDIVHVVWPFTQLLEVRAAFLFSSFRSAIEILLSWKDPALMKENAQCAVNLFEGVRGS